MPDNPSRRDVLKVAAATGLASLPSLAPAPVQAAPGWVSGHKTGARALAEVLLCEGTQCVFGIPGAQGNEFWDQMKTVGLNYLLVTHEASAAMMADGAARATGKPGVICVVPGPGITNAMTGIGEAYLDSIPMVVIAGDVARGDKYRAFQVHDLPNKRLLEPICKQVFQACTVEQMLTMVRQAFQLAIAGEPGPVAVVVPYDLLIESHKVESAPLSHPGLPFDDCAFTKALALLSNRKLRIGIHAGIGCQDHSHNLTQVAELLQAPVSTSVSGKGAINECHPLSVGWGYGAQGTETAEKIFKHVDLVLALGVRFSEVSTGFYCLPDNKEMIHVDSCANNLGKVMKSSVCVHSDAGYFLSKLLANADCIRRAENCDLKTKIKAWKEHESKSRCKVYARCGVDPMMFVQSLRRATRADALTFVDVTMTEHWMGETYTVSHPRTYFNPTDNQAMGWSIPAAMGAQRVMPSKQVVTVTGDGCFLMTAVEIATAVRECLPVKFFILDDQAYHYMQVLQKAAYRRTTATVLSKIDYASFARGLGVTHVELNSCADLEARIRGILCLPGPVLVNVVSDYGDREVRWIKAVRGRYTQELSTAQKVRFLARIGARTVAIRREND